jgi:glycosyltransferase involved in cell wall biosynthesis
MHSQPKLSILTPACWNRISESSALSAKIEAQSAGLPRGTIEHIVMLDQRTRTVGMKRQALLDAALGDYIAFVDDDDDIADDYVACILEAIEAKPDVITFHGDCTYNGLQFTVHYNLGQTDALLILDGEQGQIVKRNAWHTCAWKRELVSGCVFPDSSFGEDKVWSMQARRTAKNEAHIPRVLHYYRHDARHTLAPEPGLVDTQAKA